MNRFESSLETKFQWSFSLSLAVMLLLLLILLVLHNLVGFYTTKSSIASSLRTTTPLDQSEGNKRERERKRFFRIQLLLVHFLQAAVVVLFHVQYTPKRSVENCRRIRQTRQIQDPPICSFPAGDSISSQFLFLIFFCWQYYITFILILCSCLLIQSWVQQQLHFTCPEEDRTQSFFYKMNSNHFFM